jgi:hypothetical protein
MLIPWVGGHRFYTPPPAGIVFPGITYPALATDIVIAVGDAATPPNVDEHYTTWAALVADGWNTRDLVTSGERLLIYQVANLATAIVSTNMANATNYLYFYGNGFEITADGTNHAFTTGAYSVAQNVIARNLIDTRHCFAGGHNGSVLAQCRAVMRPTSTTGYGLSVTTGGSSSTLYPRIAFSEFNGSGPSVQTAVLTNGTYWAKMTNCTVIGADVGVSANSTAPTRRSFYNNLYHDNPNNATGDDPADVFGHLGSHNARNTSAGGEVPGSSNIAFTGSPFVDYGNGDLRPSFADKDTGLTLLSGEGQGAIAVLQAGYAIPLVGIDGEPYVAGRVGAYMGDV